MLKYKTLLLLLFFALALNAQHPPVFEGMTLDTTRVGLANLNINLVKYSYRNQKIKFLAIHDDEDTGVKAAFEYIQFSGGTLIDCQYGGSRNFRFNYHGQDFQTDPNSIYTYEGIVMRLYKFGNADNDEVIKQLERAGKAILQAYDAKKTGYFFTLHNNADGGFGINSYAKDGDLSSTADSVYINPLMDPDDLILVTEPALFNKFKKENVNAVLQSADPPDDGSLSVYAMQNKIPYINVEVQHGHQYEHLRLIEIAIKALHETYPHLKEKTAK